LRKKVGFTLCLDNTDEIELRNQAIGSGHEDALSMDDIWPEGDAVSIKLPAGIHAGFSLSVGFLIQHRRLR
jgi:hypothetical protein